MTTTTYNDSFIVEIDKAVISEETPDISNNVSTLTITTTGKVRVQVQYSTDNGVTWSNLTFGGFDYFDVTTSDVRSVSPNGVCRFNITNQSTTSITVTLKLETTTVSVTFISPEDVWRTCGLTGSTIIRGDVSSFITRAIGEIQSITRQNWELTTVTEKYFGDDTNTILVNHYPIITVTSIDIDGTSVSPSYCDIVEEYGKIILTDDAELTTFSSKSDGSRGITINYSYGYSTIPQIVKRAIENIAARKCLIFQIGGTFDDITAYTIEGLQVSKGEPYTNIRETYIRLKQEYDTEIEPYLQPAVCLV